MNYKKVFETAQKKGYTLYFDWGNPFKLNYNHPEDFKVIHEDILEVNPVFSLLELSLIQKWLRDKHELHIDISPSDSPGWAYRIEGTFYPHSRIWGNGNFESYEQTLLAGIGKALTLFKPTEAL